VCEAPMGGAHRRRLRSGDGRRGRRLHDPLAKHGGSITAVGFVFWLMPSAAMFSVFNVTCLV
jgi:hypothetical protein